MLERVAADEMAEGEDAAIGLFKNFREDIEGDDSGEVGAARVFWRKQQRQQQNENRVHLDCGVEAKIAVAGKFSGTPCQHARDSDDFEDGE